MGFGGISIWQLLIVLAIVVLLFGTKKLKGIGGDLGGAVKGLALTIGRIKRSFDSAKNEIEKQVGADEIRRQLHNEAVMDNVNKIKSELSELDKKIDSGEREMPWTEDDYNEDDEIEKYLLESHPEKATSETENKNKPSV